MTHHAPHDRPPCRRGFSFAEVMFAVMLLGIGFIMVAAIFPVAIQQQQATVQAVSGKETARNGAQLIASSRHMTAAGLPATRAFGQGHPLVFFFHDARPWHGTGTDYPANRDALWDSIKGSLIVPGTPQLAYIPVFSRAQATAATNSPTATLYIFAVQARNTSAFTPRDVNRYTGSSSAYEPNLAPKPVSITVADGGATKPDTITISDSASGNGEFRAAVEGAFVIVSDDKVTNNDASTPYDDRGYANGRVARLGTLVGSDNDSVTYNLEPGSDLIDNVARPNEKIDDATGLLIGRGYADPATPAAGYAGPSMATSRYVKIVALP